MENRTQRRLARFEELINDAWYGRLYKLSRQPELEMCRALIAETGEADDNTFVHMINRLGVYKPDDPKIRTHLVADLLMASRVDTPTINRRD
jgi:hypothetical protein